VNRRLPVRIVGALLWLLGPLACGPTLDALCDVPGCEFSSHEWELIQSLANLPDPPPDPSNAYSRNEAAAQLGQRFYFDPAFSGPASARDALNRPAPALPQSTSVMGAHMGQSIQASCATCHDPARAGVPLSAMPDHISVGAGPIGTNALSTYNTAYYDVLLWSGAVDSLWALNLFVTEFPAVMNSNRLLVAWRIADAYRGPYEAVFRPLPLTGTSLAQAGRLDASTGECRRMAGVCPTSQGCVEEPLPTGGLGCFPRFPLQGKPGNTPGCQRGNANEPFGDAFDCMAPEDQQAITRVFVDFSKAIAAYEYKLVSRNSRFDQWVSAGPDSQLIPPAARRGARLFVGKAACIDCHATPLLSDSGFHNVGVPQTGAGVISEADCVAGSPCDCVAGINCLPWGASTGLRILQSGNGIRRDGPYSDMPTDASRARYYTLAPSPALRGTWRTPSLRDVALTAPYMHNGLYRTLSDVVQHYNQGGGRGGFSGSASVRLKPLYLSAQEQADLVAFLETLTGAPLPSEVTHAPAP
jgi:cytochrome c peroxidase